MLKEKNINYGLIFVLPAFLGTLVFILIPVIASFSLSFFDWNLISKPKFVGFENYISLMKSLDFWYILKNTIVFAFFTTVFGVIIPLILATAINSKLRGSEFYKTAFFLPFITPMIVIAIIWEWIFDPTCGLLNYILKTNIQWLYDTHFAMPAVI